MTKATRELEAVQYSAAAVKPLSFCIPPFTRCFALHWHDRVEIIRVKSGELTVECGGSTVRLHADEMMVFAPAARGEPAAVIRGKPSIV